MSEASDMFDDEMCELGALGWEFPKKKISHHAIFDDHYCTKCLSGIHHCVDRNGPVNCKYPKAVGV